MASIYHPGYAQQLVSQGFGGYQGWGDDEAFADYQATRGQGKQSQAASPSSDTGSNNSTVASSPDPASNLLAQSMERFQKATDEKNRLLGEYDRNNPFSFDEYLKGEATKMAEEQQGIGTEGTYYNESLSDYLLGVGRKIERTGADARDLIGELQASSDSFSENTKLKLTETKNTARQGFANMGLFDSGARLRQEGLLERGAGDMLSEDQRQTGYRIGEAGKTVSRTQEDYGLGQFSKSNTSAYVPGLISRGQIRDQYRTSGSAVSQLAAQLTGEKEMQRNRERAQLIPPELQANQEYDMLKQLGINS